VSVLRRDGLRGTAAKAGKEAEMQMNTDPEWLKRMAELEDGQPVSVGGWVSELTSPRELFLDKWGPQIAGYDALAADLDAVIALALARAERAEAALRELRVMLPPDGLESFAGTLCTTKAELRQYAQVPCVLLPPVTAQRLLDLVRRLAALAAAAPQADTSGEQG
jgi:hypothetical protein